MKDKLWLKLLELKSLIDSYEGKIAFCHILMDGDVSINHLQRIDKKNRSILVLMDEQSALDAGKSTVFSMESHFEIEVKQKGLLKKKHLKFLQIYLPFCFFKLLAISSERAVTVAHFAQTLDGKIATTSGHSRWIGNEENLIHAHRMRALCDAIMVGSGTVKLDQPRLTVRLEPGKDPHRVILGHSCEDFSSLFKACPDRITVIGREDCSFPEGIDYFKMDTGAQQIDSEAILRFLFSRGIYGVYIEGGPRTTSNFIKDKKVDVLQLHLAPMLFGSGIQAINLPHIEQVADGLQFESFRFWKMGDAIMFAGCLV